MALPVQTSLLRRLLVGVALFGIVIVTHLALQKANGFANGCTGLGGVDYTSGAALTGEAAGCAAVTEGEYANFLGIIPNILLGLIFYVIVAGLRVAYVLRRDDRLRLAAFGVTGVGLLYTAYLIYLQAAVIGSFCVLCMTSAALVLSLFILHAMEHRKVQGTTAEEPSRRARPEPRGLAALRPYATVLGGFAVLLLGTFALAARTAPETSVSASPFVAASEGGATPALPTPNIQDVTGACTYDADYEPIADMSPFMTGPSLGNPDAETVVVKVFDPNCPHCRELSETLDTFIAENSDSARFYYVAFPLKQQSLGQVVALKLAEREGKFFELMHAMFERQDATWGMTLPELVETASSVGMDGAALQRMLENPTEIQPLLEQIQTQSNAVTEAFAKPDGGFSVPKLAVNGRVVAPTYASYSTRCLAEFVAGGGE